MIAIVVVCVGFLIFMIVLGVVRIRNAHARSSVQEEKPEMEWDNSALNITVNPLEESSVPQVTNFNDCQANFIYLFFRWLLHMT